MRFTIIPILLLFLAGCEPECGTNSNSDPGSNSWTFVIRKSHVTEGERLFKRDCATCHAVKKKLVGPALKDATTKYEKEWLYKWVRNSEELIKSGDSLAVKVWMDYNKTMQTPFPGLTDEEIDAIFIYVDSVKNINPPALPGR